MDWDVIAPMIASVVFILTTGGVLVLRPITKRLGHLLEVMAREKAALPTDELRRLRETMETVNQRMVLLEERQDFTERLLERGDGDPRRVEPSSAPLRVEGS